MTNKRTKAKVFIIESLGFEDEKKELYEGGILSDILRLSKIETQYFYIRTKKEFKKVVEIFEESNYRYLHISCHGGENSLCTTLDEIPYDELGEILKDSLFKKRLFLSACSAVNKKLAQSVIPKTKCYSIIGPDGDIAFSDATIMWASFYHLMFNENSQNMLSEGLVKNLQKVVDTFGESLNYYSISKSQGFKNIIIRLKRSRRKVKTEEDIIK